MKMAFPNGIWPTMVTPFTESGDIDYSALGKMVDWYIENGSSGLFSTCQSSESFFLSLRERIELTRFVRERAGGRVPVIASGHVSYAQKDQEEELKAMADAGAEAVILISNRLAAQNEPDSVFLHRLDALLKALPEDLPLGFYECPYPYKRVLSPEVTRYCAQSGRFYFLKDTSCDMENIREKLSLLKGSPMRLYNANTATLLESLRGGAAGYSGVMANFHPRLYRWLLDHWEEEPEKAELVQDALTMCSFIELKNYPASAKANFSLFDLPVRFHTRKNPASAISDTEWAELRQMKQLTDQIGTLLKL